MNRKQWSVLGVGLLLLGLLFINLTKSCAGFGLSAELLIACSIQRYAFGIPAFILSTLGVLFIIIGFLEKKKVK